jgi:two-component response regulator ARR-A family
VLHLAPTHLGWDTQRQFYSSVQGHPGVETLTAVVPVDASELEKYMLAVDDKSVDRAAIARILCGSRYRVTAVESATRALELLAMGLLPDVSMIITDYWMPWMTGYELLKRVKESVALRGIYVVNMSSMTIVIYTFSNKFYDSSYCISR